MQCDLLYNIGDLSSGTVDMAIIALDEAVNAAWPLDAINEGLEYRYNASLDLPWVYPVHDSQGVIGWVVTSRNDRLDAEQVYWDIIEHNELGDRKTGRLEKDTPFVVDSPGNQASIVVYPLPFGSDFPCEPVNECITTLMSQDDWLDSGAIYLYPVKKGGSHLISGLLLADTMNDLAEDSELDDVFFKKIRDLNKEYGKLYAQFPKKRYTV